MKTYQGNCFCGAVAFEAEGDLADGTMRCNCTFCRKMRYWELRLPDPAGFRLLRGEEKLAKTPPSRHSDGGPDHMDHYFCKQCGTRLWTHGNITEMGGEFRAVFVPALDATEDELIAAPIAYLDGAHDNWWNPAPETRHL